jgi:hypothetical protein
MRSRRVILAVSLALLGGVAQAAEKPKEVGQYVDLQPVALPIVVDGRLVNYVFVYLRINLNDGVEVSKVREKEPFFRDALVREAHRTPFVVPGDWQKVDERRLTAVMVRDAQAIAGPGLVSSVAVTSQTPQKPVVAPRAAGPGRP